MRCLLTASALSAAVVFSSVVFPTLLVLLVLRTTVPRLRVMPGLTSFLPPSLARTAPLDARPLISSLLYGSTALHAPVGLGVTTLSAK